MIRTFPSARSGYCEPLLAASWSLAEPRWLTEFSEEAGLILEWDLATRHVIDTDHIRITNATRVPCLQLKQIPRNGLEVRLSRGNEVCF